MEDLKHFSNFLDELALDNSRNYKLNVLKKYKDDNTVRYFLNYIFNPYLVTGISDKKLKKGSELDIINDDDFSKITTTKNLLEYIKENNTGKDHVLKTIKYFKAIKLAAEEESVKLIEILDAIITKNLIVGVEALSINKAIPGLIPTFEVMLANSYFDKPDYIKGKEFAITTKIDGGRIIALKENGEVSLYTRAGQKYEGLADLEEELRNLPLDNICFDGEITLLNSEGLSSKDQYKQTMKITRKDGEKHGVKMLVFDFMLANEFKEQCCKEPYKYRREALDAIFDKYDLTYFTCLPVLYSGSDINEINKWLNYSTSIGEEGIMINLLSAPYQFKRTNDLMKVKKMHDVDLTIIGFEEGANKNKGRLGAFIVDYKGNSVKVGSGLDDKLREEIWNHPEDYIGLTISVQYFEETTNDKGGLSLRFPVFLDFRYDK